MQPLHIQLDKPGIDTSSSVSVQSPRGQDAGGSSFEKQLEKAIQDTAGTQPESSDAVPSEYITDSSVSGRENVSEPDMIIRNLELLAAGEPAAGIEADGAASIDTTAAISRTAAGAVQAELAGSGDAAEVIFAELGSELTAGAESAEKTVSAADIHADAGLLAAVAAAGQDGIESEKAVSAAESDREEVNSGRKTQKQHGHTAADGTLAASIEAAVLKPDAALNTPFEPELPGETADSLKRIKLATGTALDDKIQVTDARSAAAGVTEAGIRESDFVTSVSYGEGSADITMNLKGDSGPAAGTSASAAKAGESHFASLLSSELQNNAAEFVKTGSIVLRDGNAGTINLILHPEELGNVKISLNLHDKLISGHITVASEDAYNAFKNNIDSIKQAFNASGFETAGFDLSWSGGAQSGSQHNFQNQTAAQEPFFKHTLYADMVNDGDFSEDEFFAQKIYSDSAQIAVNIMA